MSRRGTPTVLPTKTLYGRRPSSQPRTHETTARSAAVWVVERTLDSLAPSSTFLTSALAQCEERDQGLLRELSLGTLRWLRRLDHVLAGAANRSIEAIEPKLRAPLRIGAYQLLFLDRIPAHAAVNEAVAFARRITHRGGVSFTNAVLRRIARQASLEAWPVEVCDPVTRLAVEKSHPDFLVRRWVDRLGLEATEHLLDANNRSKALSLLAFVDRGGSEALAERLIESGVQVEPSALAPRGLVVRDGNPLATSAYRRGDFYIQDEASQVAALLPPIRPGERILDAAASPGGKTFSILAHEPTARVVMADVAPGRLSRIRANLGRLGRPVPMMMADAGRPATSTAFDRVVVDLPCTGTGTLRKHPELKWRISEGEIGRLTRQSLRLLDGAARQVVEGGLLVAVTCSLEREENHDVVAAFLERHPEFAPVDLAPLVTAPLDRWIVGLGSWQIAPDGDHDGFTVHVLRRT